MVFKYHYQFMTPNLCFFFNRERHICRWRLCCLIRIIREEYISTVLCLESIQIKFSCSCNYGLGTHAVPGVIPRCLSSCGLVTGDGGWGLIDASLLCFSFCAALGESVLEPNIQFIAFLIFTSTEDTNHYSGSDIYRICCL